MRAILLVMLFLAAAPLFAQENLLQSFFGIHLGVTPAEARGLMGTKSGLTLERDTASGAAWMQVYSGGALDGCDLPVCKVQNWILLFLRGHLVFVQINVGAGPTEEGAAIVRYRALRNVLIGRYGKPQFSFAPEKIPGWNPGVKDADLYDRMVSSDTWLYDLWLFRSADDAIFTDFHLDHDHVKMIYQDAKEMLTNVDH